MFYGSFCQRYVFHGAFRAENRWFRKFQGVLYKLRHVVFTALFTFHCMISLSIALTNHDPRDAVNAPRFVLPDFFGVDVHPMLVARVERIKPVVHKLLMGEAFIFGLFHCG